MTTDPVLLCSDAYGTRVGLRVARADVGSLRPFLPFWWVDVADDAPPELVWDLPVVASARSVVAELELAVAERARGLVFVHAAVVARDGRALLLPGPSHAGKSTLTDALVRAGATYGSDEYAPLAPDGTVHPYPRPLRLRDGAGGRTPPAAAPPFEGPLPVAAVAVVRFRAGSAYDLRPVSAGTAVLGLLANTVAAQSRAVEALATLATVTATALTLEGTRGEADAAATALLALLDA